MSAAVDPPDVARWRAVLVQLRVLQGPARRRAFAVARAEVARGASVDGLRGALAPELELALIEALATRSHVGFSGVDAWLDRARAVGLETALLQPPTSLDPETLFAVTRARLLVSRPAAGPRVVEASLSNDGTHAALRFDRALSAGPIDVDRCGVTLHLSASADATELDVPMAEGASDRLDLCPRRDDRDRVVMVLGADPRVAPIDIGGGIAKRTVVAVDRP